MKITSPASKPAASSRRPAEPPLKVAGSFLFIFIYPLIFYVMILTSLVVLLALARRKGRHIV